MSKMGEFILELETFEQAANGFNEEESRTLLELFFNDDFERRYAWDQYLIRKKNNASRVMEALGQSDWD